jgi:hypothetical protein
MNLEIKNDLLNLPNLQLTMDRIVFDHIDTLPNWSKAYKLLDELLQRVAISFNTAVDKKAGELPKASTYWVLYMDIAAKLLYFTGLAHSHLIDEQDVEVKQHLINLYHTSAVCLPNAQVEENEELLNEIKKSIKVLAEQNEQHTEIQTSNSIDECILKFEKFAKTYR